MAFFFIRDNITLMTKHHPTPIPTQTLATLTVHQVDTGNT